MRYAAFAVAQRPWAKVLEAVGKRKSNCKSVSSVN